MKLLLGKEVLGRKNLKEALTAKQKPQPLSITIDFDTEKIIGLKEVKRLMNVYRNMLELVPKEELRQGTGGTIRFLLQDKIENFDLTFIAVLNLIKFSFKNIDIHLHFTKIKKGTAESDCFYRFGHFLLAGFLSNGREIYKMHRYIIDENKQTVEKEFKVNSFCDILTGYLPFIYIEEKYFNRLFHEPFNDVWDGFWDAFPIDFFKRFKNKKSKSDDIYQELRQYVIRRIDLGGSSNARFENNIMNFCITYLFNAARKFLFVKKIIKNQAQSERFKHINLHFDKPDIPLGIGLSHDEDIEYERELQTVFDKILDKPPVFVMLFSYFIRKFYDPKVVKNGTGIGKIKEKVELISNIFYFTNEIFYGIRELAKNIVEHSSTHRGIILGRVLDIVDVVQLKADSKIRSYLKKRKEKEFIDLIVLDDGAEGIIEKTIKNLNILQKQFKEDKEILSKFKEDIDNLENDRIGIHDFFNPQSIKLNYQGIRSALSLGLLIFSHLVQENKGYMMVSTQHRSKTTGLEFFKGSSGPSELTEMIPLGTFYNILFPRNLKKPPTPRSEIVPFEMPSGESAFYKLFKIVRNCRIPDTIPAENDESGYNNRLCFIDHKPTKSIVKDNIEEIADIFKTCQECSLKKVGKILCLNLKHLAATFDPSDLFRFLARIQMVKDVKSIIVYNVMDEMVKRIIGFFEIFKKVEFKIGSSDHFVLFYYQKHEDEHDVDCYYSFLLAGETWDDLYWINNRIQKSNYVEEELWLENGKEITDVKDIKPSRQFLKDYCLNPMFTREGHLLPFDVLIKKSKLTLFERNALADLNKQAGFGAARSYKFSDAHMRLGSKIHLEDFFYARRIFQNSFYSLRFAYLIARFINEKIDKWLRTARRKNNSHPTTILGYGLYSELLISNITRFLNKTHPNWDINHALIDQVDPLEIKGSLNKNIILIIPISSTLSTSLKIQMKLKKKYADSNTIGYPINVMIVGNGSPTSIIDENGKVIEKTAGYYWDRLDLDKKIITAQAFLKSNRKEKFFLFLPSKWYLPLECEMCFPKDPVNERVLFETDKVSVTPSLIFELPPSKELTEFSSEILFGENADGENPGKKAILTADMLYYGHINRGSNHYLYYVETTDFLKENKKQLEEWLKMVKEELEKRDELIFDSKIILIAPAHDTNADFVNMVNEIIFNDVATIFHYQQNEDYIQNLKSFFGDDITRESYVFFIDDAVSTGKTFERINDFVKYARSEKDYSRGIDGAFALINRLTQDRYSIIKNALKKPGFFAFIDLDVPIMIDTETFCHLCSEQQKYQQILDQTILDSLRILTRSKIIKLNTKKYEPRKTRDQEKEKKTHRYLKDEKYEFSKEENHENYLKRLEIVHNLYRGFSDKKVKTQIEEVINAIGSLESLCDAIKLDHFHPLSPDEKVNVIKVLAHPYFVYHKEIRKYIFKIIITEFAETIQALEEKIEGELDSKVIHLFRYFKFLIRRTAILKANYLIRRELLEKIIKVINGLLMSLEQSGPIQKQFKDYPLFKLTEPERNRLERFLNEFVDYYSLAVKEAVWYNESKALKLEQTLDELQKTFDAGDRTYRLLSESLRIENSSIPYQFMELLKNENQLPFDKLLFSEISYENDIQLLANIILDYCDQNPYRSSPLLQFLGFKSREENEEVGSLKRDIFLRGNKIFNSKILPMILLRAFFLNEEKKKREQGIIKSKMDYILFVLCKILDIDQDQGGAFFVVKYLEPDEGEWESGLFTVGHVGLKKELYTFEWATSQTLKMFQGQPPSFTTLPLTYVGIFRKGGPYVTHLGEIVKKDDISEARYLSPIKNFHFLRIADDDVDSTARGVMVFYRKDNSPILPEHLRYALLLKNDIYGFLDRNYENDSFRLWSENVKIDNFIAHMLHRIKRNIIAPLELKTILTTEGKKDTAFLHALEGIHSKLASYAKVLSKYGKSETFKINIKEMLSMIISEFAVIYSNQSKKIVPLLDELPDTLMIRVPIPHHSATSEGESVLEELFEVVIGNILDNAFEHGEADRVDIRCYSDVDKLILEVQDFGKGIKKKSNILYGSSQSDRGLGLGLRIIKGIVETLLGGKSKMKSLEDNVKGVLFIIQIPIQKEDKDNA